MLCVIIDLAMSTNSLRIASYSRVSTSDKSQNTEVQATELRRYCVARGWQISEEIADRGFSGGTDQRPGLKRLLALVRARKVDVVVVVKMDRLFRSLRHLVSVLDELQSLGVLFVSVGDQIDLSTASGRLMTQIIGAFGEFEKSLIRERTLAGLAYARSLGKTLGRPKTRDDVAILALRERGMTFGQIQKELGVSKGAVCRAMKPTPKSPSPKPTKSTIKTRAGNG
jgi:DNA invertase Pin-like site-specific DNA recombinase